MMTMMLHDRRGRLPLHLVNLPALRFHLNLIYVYPGRLLTKHMVSFDRDHPSARDDHRMLVQYRGQLQAN
jgi:hypothetical protein